MDPASVFHNPVTNGYWGLTTAGHAYAVVYAEDGDGTVDRRVDQRPGGAAGLVDRVDGGGATPADIALRSKVMSFYVDKAPRLLRTNPGFTPTVNQLLARTVNFNLPADDVDQLDPKAPFNRVGGTPTYPPILRRKIAILGKLTSDPTKDTCYVVPGEFNAATTGAINVPAYIAGGNITVRIRLCDCLECDDLRWPTQCPFSAAEANPGQGRCIDTDIPARIAAPEPAGISSGNSDEPTQRPGSSLDSGSRRQR
jgi:hypothetical protein